MGRKAYGEREKGQWKEKHLEKIPKKKKLKLGEKGMWKKKNKQ